MFGFVVTKPVSTEITETSAIGNDTLVEHQKLAASLGIKSDAGDQIRRREFEAFLKERGIRVYDRAQVAKYLTKQYGKPKRSDWDGWSGTWGWRPLRDRDGSNNFFRSFERYHDNDQILLGARAYSKPVPIPVMLMVKELIAKYPYAAFYVSDEYTAPPVPDPFLMVTFEANVYIIERWDEPNYKER